MTSECNSLTNAMEHNLAIIKLSLTHILHSWYDGVVSVYSAVNNVCGLCQRNQFFVISQQRFNLNKLEQTTEINKPILIVSDFTHHNQQTDQNMN